METPKRLLEKYYDNSFYINYIPKGIFYWGTKDLAREITEEGRKFLNHGNKTN